MSQAVAGFRKGVRYLRDVGFVYLDDGFASFRIEEASFDELLRACFEGDCEKVVDFYPTLFQLYDSTADAELSIAGARF